MDKLLKTCKFGITEYLKKGPISTLKNIKFGGNKSTFGSSSDHVVYYEPSESCDSDELLYGFLGLFMIVILITMTIYAFLAVEKLCPGQSERSKNTRLGLYVLLIISGGSVSWILIVMSLLNISLC